MGRVILGNCILGIDWLRKILTWINLTMDTFYQDTYELDTHELAEGRIKNATATKSLTADDCFKIGRTAYLENDHYHCVLWMREADAKIMNGDTTHER